MEPKMLNLSVSEQQLRSILFLIHQRQHDIRRIPQNSRTYQKFFAVDCELEKLKMCLAKQFQ